MTRSSTIRQPDLLLLGLRARCERGALRWQQRAGLAKAAALLEGAHRGHRTIVELAGDQAIEEAREGEIHLDADALGQRQRGIGIGSSRRRERAFLGVQRPLLGILLGVRSAFFGVALFCIHRRSLWSRFGYHHPVCRIA